jgi:hypothetical protein
MAAPSSGRLSQFRSRIMDTNPEDLQPEEVVPTEPAEEDTPPEE